MKKESLVIVDQHATVNMFLGLVHTARQGLKGGSVLSFHRKIEHKVWVLVPVERGPPPGRRVGSI